MKTGQLPNFAFTAFILSVSVVTSVCQTKPNAKTTTSSNLPQIAEVERPATYSIDPKTLPAPFATQSANRGSREVSPPANAKLMMPKGFKVNVFAEGNFKNPRWAVLAPNGDVFLADSGSNSVIVLRDANHDGVAEQRFVFSNKLSQPFGMAFQ